VNFWVIILCLVFVHQNLLACLVHQSLAGQTPLYLASDIQLTADTGRPQLRSASERIWHVLFHAHTTASATEAFLLLALGCGTPYHHICGGTWTTDISSMHWEDVCLGYSRPRRIVTKLLSCALGDYLLTYSCLTEATARNDSEVYKFLPPPRSFTQRLI